MGTKSKSNLRIFGASLVQYVFTFLTSFHDNIFDVNLRHIFLGKKNTLSDMRSYTYEIRV